MTALSSDAEISPLESPGSADEFTASPLASPTDAGDTSLRSPLSPASVSNMTTSSTPLGNINAARRPPIAVRGPNAEIMAKLDALKLSRSNVPAQTGRSASTPMSPAPQSPGPAGNGFPAGFKLPAALQRPVFPVSTSSPAIVGAAKPQGRVLSLAEKRGVKMPGGLPGSTPQSPSMGPKKVRPSMKLSDMGEGATKDVNGDDRPAQKEKNKLQMYAEYIDADRGALTFKNKAVVHSQGVDFASGRSFSISLDDDDSLGELGKGNYGTVYKVRHSKPSFRQPGLGLARARRDQEEDGEGAAAPDLTPTKGTGTTGIIMAMKEMRLELEDTKFAQIIMELDILHRCISPFIVDFYGAFFQEGAIYICMEWMDGGSVDKLYADGVPENVLRKITYSTVMGLKGLKEGHNIIHRDVKPTNILINTRGQVKICDFGVSGNLVASIAKTNIGCQSYMAPERISGGGVAQAGANAAAGGTYSVQSDIWSLGLSIIECALGHYPYPPETYENIFSQLSAIVDGNPPDLPADQFSEAARDFVAGCLNKIPNLRPTYPMLLQHAWLAPLDKPATIAEEDEDAEGLETTESTHVNGNGTVPTPASSTAPNGEQFHDREVGEWVMQALDRRRKGLLGKSTRPALHAAPLDATFQAASKTTPPAPVSG